MQSQGNYMIFIFIHFFNLRKVSRNNQISYLIHFAKSAIFKLFKSCLMLLIFNNASFQHKICPLWSFLSRFWYILGDGRNSLFNKNRPSTPQVAVDLAFTRTYNRSDNFGQGKNFGYYSDKSDLSERRKMLKNRIRIRSEIRISDCEP